MSPPPYRSPPPDTCDVSPPQNQVALLQKLVSSSVKQNTAPQIKPREDWTPVTIFQNHEDAKVFIGHEGMWRFSYSNPTALGRKVCYSDVIRW